MHVHQIATTAGQPCGVGVFAQRLEEALTGIGIPTATSRAFEMNGSADAVLIHHEWGIVNSKELREFCRASQQPVILFPHSADATEFRDVVHGFITMNDGVVKPTHLPHLQVPHAAHAPAELSPRSLLKERFGFSHARAVIGASGFLTHPRHFAFFVRRLLPLAREHSWLIAIFAPTHSSTPPERVDDLRRLQEQNPEHVYFENTFLPNEDLNFRLQACDLLWCWTSMRDSSQYASGVAADMYGSGTRMVVSNKRQHAHVFGRDNVVVAPSAFEPFLKTVIDEAKAGRFARHNPAGLSWQASARDIGRFISSIVECPSPAPCPHVRTSCGLLQSRQQIASAWAHLEAHGWTHHSDSVKDWGLANLVGDLSGDLLDIGCGDSCVLPNAVRVLSGRVVGIDAQPKQAVNAAEVLAGDLTETSFASCSFDTITCLSVIGHGIDIRALGREAARLLRPGGKFIATFDYWQPKIATGIPGWDILNREQTLELIDVFHADGLKLESNVDWTKGEAVIHHEGHHYTFALLRFTR